MKRQTFLFLLVLGSNTLFAQYTGAHNDGYGTSLSSGINTTFIGSLAILKAGIRMAMEQPPVRRSIRILSAT
ncbi:MAG: hypothetical protein HWD58_09440 [Bacteroidota bacterium]|nr:MAG: hypothetical protein HWD58_09440 [Bacteroidota bacterium]